MQRALEDLEKRWGLAIQSAAFGVWDLDVPGHRVHYSPQWKAMLGYVDDDAPDSTAVWRERVHPSDLPPMLDALSHHLSGDHPSYEMEFRLRAANGQYRWVLSRGQVVERGPGGEPLRAVGTLTDVTDRREAERLRTERDRAEAASRAKTDFLARMSHELRTPLNAVLGFAQLLGPRLGSQDVQDQKRYVEHIEQAGWHLLTMIDDVLELARIDAGQLEIRRDPVPLGALVDAAVESLRPLAQQGGVGLAPVQVPSHAIVQADPARLRQVLVNLLNNAVKYNRRGGTVSVTAAREGPSWVLRVADTGIGIPPEQLPHLFVPFNRVGRSAGMPPGMVPGIGVGLVLVRALLEAMGGSILVDSAEGRGTVFTVALPAGAAPTAGG